MRHVDRIALRVTVMTRRAISCYGRSKMITVFAQKYIDDGYAVVPIPAKKKGPVIPGWQSLQIKDVSVISEGSNLGIILGKPSGGLVCVDLDHESAVELAPKFLPPTGLIAGRDGAGKVHWFYRVEEPMRKIAFTSACKTRIIEILAEGQQVVAGPSVHPDGGIYDVLDGSPAEVSQKRLVKCVEELFSACLLKLGMSSNQKTSGNLTAFIPSNANVSDLYSTLIQHGASILGEGSTPSGNIGYYVVCPGESFHTTANNKKDCMVWIGSCGGWQARCQHSSCGVNSWNEFKSALDPMWISNNAIISFKDIKPTVENNTPIEEVAEPFPQDCLRPGGTISRIINQNLSTAMYPMPELALAGALAMMSVITGRKVQDRRELRTNGYYLGLAAAGSGKNFARQLNAKILMSLGADDTLGPSKLKSSSGLVNALVAQPACLFQLDEISRLLHTMRNPKESPHLYDIGSVMLEAYGEANALWKPGAYADSKKNPIVDQPHLVVYGTAVPDEFWGSITVGNLTDGLLGRMMVFEFSGETVLTESELTPLNEDMLSEIKAWLSYEPAGSGNLKNFSPRPTVIQHTDEAWTRYWGHTKDIVNGKPDESQVVKGIWRRTAEKTGKLAILSACSRISPVDGLFPVIELCDVNWAIKLSNWLTRRLLNQAGLYVAENQHQDNLNRILRLIPDWTRQECIGAKVRWMKARDRNELIASAIIDGLIEQRSVDTSGRSRTEWRRLSAGNL